MAFGMTILIVDAQGGGMGKALAEKLVQARLEAEVIGVGTNSMASAALRKAGVSATATGENAVVYNAAHADIIAGGIGILCANAMMGEISPRIAAAISESPAVKVLIPLNRCNLRVCGALEKPLTALLDDAVADIRRLVEAAKK